MVGKPANQGTCDLGRGVVGGLRAPRLPLVKSPAQDVPPFDPAHPDAVAAFQVPASPRHTAETPLGN